MLLEYRRRSFYDIMVLPDWKSRREERVNMSSEYPDILGDLLEAQQRFEA
ncbi:MAG: hypothetical protein GX597_06615, partial [Anaerolineaceae bacterium]|nr:hypothetical protein [Anaerolineaceae bacterium]